MSHSPGPQTSLLSVLCLRSRQCFYSYIRLFFRFAEELHSPFAAVVPQPSCPETLQEEIYKLILKSRNNQLYRTIPLDLSKDTRLAGNIILPCLRNWF